MPEIFNSSHQTQKRTAPLEPDEPGAVLSGQPQKKELEQIKKERPGGLLASFLPHPHRWSFETQEMEEKIILILRRHWIVNLGWQVGGVFFVILPPLVMMNFDLGFLPWRYLLAGVWIWYLLLAGFWLERFLDWFFNVFIITDERIVDFDFYGLIYKEISDAKIENIQDVTYKVAGFLPNLLDYGSVLIQTAAQIPQFEFMDVPHPARVARVLRELITEEEVEKIEGRVR